MSAHNLPTEFEQRSREFWFPRHCVWRSKRSVGSVIYRLARSRADCDPPPLRYHHPRHRCPYLFNGSLLQKFLPNRQGHQHRGPRQFCNWILICNLVLWQSLVCHGFCPPRKYVPLKIIHQNKTMTAFFIIGYYSIIIAYDEVDYLLIIISLFLFSNFAWRKLRSIYFSTEFAVATIKI